MRSLSHVRELDEALEDWGRYQIIPLEDLLKERDLRNMVLHALLVSIQAAIDIAKLDMETVYDILQNDREPLRIFRDEIKRILRNSSLEHR
jgi:uncharacterized protein YutE (UPF0331/DUF86 family)